MPTARQIHAFLDVSEGFLRRTVDGSVNDSHGEVALMAFAPLAGETSACCGNSGNRDDDASRLDSIVPMIDRRI